MLATGARPHAPELPGIGLREVYTFRDLKDAERLLARRVRSRHTVVLSGGLLGLEAARAMRRFNTRVTVIDHNPRLLFKHLDAGAALLVKQQVESFGIRVILSDGISSALGEGALRAVQLRGGDVLECDTLIGWRITCPYEIRLQPPTTLTTFIVLRGSWSRMWQCITNVPRESV